jgi:hypothetical protein
MNHISPSSEPPRVPPVETDLLASAVFLFAEYLNRLEAERVAGIDDEDADVGDEEDDSPEVETRAVLDLFAEDLGTDVKTTLNLYLRVTALYRLLAASPSIARMAVDGAETGGTLTDTALVAAARLDLSVQKAGSDGAADFDPREFRTALEDDE